jgi:hypothetical protein
MIRKLNLLIIALLFTCFGKLDAQNDSVVNDFITRVDNYCKSISENTSNVSITKRICDRKVKIEVRFEDNSKRIIQKIRYYKGGTKKEKIDVIIMGPKRPLTLLKIVLINDKYFFIHHIMYSLEDIDIKTSDEQLVDGKIYRRINYNDHGKKTNQINIWEMKRK